MTVEPHDQTRGDSTPFIDDGQTALLSRNEVLALCMKAARGAGMSWGLAEEAGFAAAWLVQHGFDGPRYLQGYLARAEGREWADLCPIVGLGEWRAAAGMALCPIALGATLCDHAALPEGPVQGCSIRIGPVDHPVLLIPFLAEIGMSNKVLIDLVWDDGPVCIDGDPSTLVAAVTALDGKQKSVSLTTRPGAMQVAAARNAPRTTADTISSLNTLAMRTTVPSSDASRAGAGSTSSDND